MLLTMYLLSLLIWAEFTLRRAPSTWGILQQFLAKYYGKDQKNVPCGKSAPGYYITFIKRLHVGLR